MSGVEALVGQWTLIAAVQITDELPVEDEGVAGGRPPEMAAWLRGDGGDLAPNGSPAAGLTLTVRADGRFEERFLRAAELGVTVEFYDRHGIATLPPEPFDGRLRTIDGKAWAAPTGDGPPLIASDDSPVRYDEGDTVVSEQFSVREGRLLRTQNVVTDELYLSRSVFIYDRATP
ncbi:hypothetical protein [Alienimonas californiensis]|uniref:Lipocalin-like domain-containing protein n=1 Tax=Alienimonas californiensis TaxID=2527989 RepID=A0A517PFG0_9PLAN|nr:hypothetical protein [Alienimonas californiensis]QDT18117.1 hypothetical protein CA12_42570 [Alienimonas californiensis]